MKKDKEWRKRPWEVWHLMMDFQARVVGGEGSELKIKRESCKRLRLE